MATRLGTTLSLYDAAIGGVETVGSDLGQSLVDAIGTGEGAGLQEAIENGFAQFAAHLNSEEAGVPLFGGGQSERPFAPRKLADLSADPADDFSNGAARATARVGEHLDLTYGVAAGELGTAIARVFKTLSDAGPFGATVTTAQRDTLRAAKAELDTAMIGVRGINAENGRRQADAETLATRADQRALLLKDVIGRAEDADLGEVATNLAQQKAMLQASYSVFGQLSGLSLIDYLR